jgi:ABC-2 type transport system permease protein
MIPVVRSEFIRIWRPTLRYGGIGLMAGFAVMISVFIYTSLGSADQAMQPGGGPGVAVADVAQPGGMLAALGSVGSLAGIVLLSLWAIATASDYDTGLVRILVQAQPSRFKLLGGKMVALCLYTVLATAVTVLTVVLVARPLARFEGIETEIWKTDFLAELAVGYFNFLVPSLVWGLIGLTIALLTRSSGLAIAIGIGYLLVVENLIGIVAPDVTDYLPGGTLAALTQGGTADLGWVTALLLTVAYGATAAAISMLVFRRRDIVS